jgi:SAM-dependent methyltransferase
MGKNSSSEFWDLLAPHHQALENSYLDLASLRGIIHAIQAPVLIVGAGQGLLVEELRNRGLQCDGIDASSQMVKYAKLRRGITLVSANASAMPFEKGTYPTIIYATGVVDFLGDEEEIRRILDEGGRVLNRPGRIFVAFYRLSDAQVHFLPTVGLLRNNLLSHRQCLEMYLLTPIQTVAWVAKQANASTWRAATMILRLSALCTLHEKVITLRMHRIFRNRDFARALIAAAPEQQPYRNEAEIRDLFSKLAIPIQELRTFRSCHIVQI